jgi:phage/plasmid-associated DNA primase
MKNKETNGAVQEFVELAPSIIYTKDKELYILNDYGIYEPLAEEELREMLFKTLQASNPWGKWLRHINYQKSVVKNLKTKVFTEEELNSNKNVLGFPNGVYDFEKNEFRKGKKEEYITMSMKHNYDEKFDYSLAEKTIKDIFPDNECYDYAMKIFAKSLIGNDEQQVTINYGYTASNGKSFLMERLNETFGDYGTLISPNLSYRTDKELKELHNIRFINYLEQKINEKIKTSIFINYNRLPSLDAINKNINRNLNIIEFPISFTENPKGKTERKRKVFNKEQLIEIERGLVNILINYHYKDVKEPIKYKALKELYINGSENVKLAKELKKLLQETKDNSDYIDFTYIKDKLKTKTTNENLKFFIEVLFPKSKCIIDKTGKCNRVRQLKFR